MALVGYFLDEGVGIKVPWTKIECAFDLKHSDSCMKAVYHSETWVLKVKISLQ